MVLTKPIKIILLFNKKRKPTKTRYTKIKNEPTISKRTKKYADLNKKTNNNRFGKASESDLVFSLPDPSFLKKNNTKNSDLKEIEKFNKINSEKLKKILSEYGVDGNVTGFRTGPIVTLYEFIPNAGINTSGFIVFSYFFQNL